MGKKLLINVIKDIVFMMTLYQYSCSEVWKFMMKWVQKICLVWLLKEMHLEINERTNMKGCQNVKKVQTNKTERTMREKDIFFIHEPNDPEGDERIL